MKVLITGGAGYIGSAITAEALQAGFGVRVIDALWYDKDAHRTYLDNPDYEFRKGDITNDAHLGKVLEGIDFVVHAAAVVGDPASKKFPDLAQKVNYEASIKLIDRLKDENIKGFIFLSTCSNYGISKGFATEETVLKPLSLYAKTKVDVERYIIDNKKCPDWIVCRLSTAYGYSPRMRFDLTINDFAMNAFRKKSLDIFLPYTHRPYIHVVDVARIVTEIIKKFDMVKNNIFNVGFNGENYQKIQIVEAIKKFLPDIKVKIVNKGVDLRDYQVDFSKLQRYLGLERKCAVEDGIREVIDLLSSGAIKDSNDRKYYNIYPVLEDNLLLNMGH
jgi:nucleoside-diphosphate-sugar epimerase